MITAALIPKGDIILRINIHITSQNASHILQKLLRVSHSRLVKKGISDVEGGRGGGGKNGLRNRSWVFFCLSDDFAGQCFLPSAARQAHFRLLRWMFPHFQRSKSFQDEVCTSSVFGRVSAAFGFIVNSIVGSVCPRGVIYWRTAITMLACLSPEAWVPRAIHVLYCGHIGSKCFHFYA